MSEGDFQEFPKIPRWSRRIIITEKIDGTNGLVYVGGDGIVKAGSRSKWINLGQDHDNHGFATWVKTHEIELRELGPCYHYGEWWGLGINRGYGLKEKRWSLLNTSKWGEKRPSCCHVVPILYDGLMSQDQILIALDDLRDKGSMAAPDFKPAEGIVIYHVQGNLYFKKTILNDELPKGLSEPSAQ